MKYRTTPIIGDIGKGARVLNVHHLMVKQDLCGMTQPSTQYLQAKFMNSLQIRDIIGWPYKMCLLMQIRGQISRISGAQDAIVHKFGNLEASRYGMQTNHTRNMKSLKVQLEVVIIGV